jgi:hypothetical protein
MTGTGAKPGRDLRASRSRRGLRCAQKAPKNPRSRRQSLAGIFPGRISYTAICGCFLRGDPQIKCLHSEQLRRTSLICCINSREKKVIWTYDQSFVRFCTLLTSSQTLIFLRSIYRHMPGTTFQLMCIFKKSEYELNI